MCTGLSKEAFCHLAENHRKPSDAAWELSPLAVSYANVLQVTYSLPMQVFKIQFFESWWALNVPPVKSTIRLTASGGSGTLQGVVSSLLGSNSTSSTGIEQLLSASNPPSAGQPPSASPNLQVTRTSHREVFLR